VILAALLAALLSWAPPLLDCRGGAEAGPLHYTVRWAFREVIGTTMVSGEPMPVYSPFSWSALETVPASYCADLHDGEGLRCRWVIPPAPQPAVGAFLVTEVTAYDPADNPDCGGKP
jgi:hypothetical protein